MGSEKRALVVLFRNGVGEEVWAALSQRYLGHEGVSVHLPPVRGRQFLATRTSEEAAQLDGWWANEIPNGATAVLLIAHEPQLSHWLRGLDVDAAVSVPDLATASQYSDLPYVQALVGASPLELANAALGTEAPGASETAPAATVEPEAPAATQSDPAAEPGFVAEPPPAPVMEPASPVTPPVEGKPALPDLDSIFKVPPPAAPATESQRSVEADSRPLFAPAEPVEPNEAELESDEEDPALAEAEPALSEKSADSAAATPDDLAESLRGLFQKTVEDEKLLEKQAPKPAAPPAPSAPHDPGEIKTDSPEMAEILAQLSSSKPPRTPAAPPAAPGRTAPADLGDDLDSPEMQDVLRQLGQKPGQRPNRRPGATRPGEDDEEWMQGSRPVSISDFGTKRTTRPGTTNPPSTVSEVDGQAHRVMRPLDILAGARPVISSDMVPTGQSSPSISAPPLPAPKMPAGPAPIADRFQLPLTTTKGPSVDAVRPSGLFEGITTRLGLRNVLSKKRLMPPPDLTRILVDKKPVVVAVISRKGGVAKTTNAAALAVLAGEALSSVGATAAIVDANINNPDQWGQMTISDGTPTVRDIMTRLLRGQELPGPVHSHTPALAVYPESREAGETYPPNLISRFATHLRRRHFFIVIDLPNHMPGADDLGMVVYQWLKEADVVVVPTSLDPKALGGAMDVLQAEEMRNKSVVVPYIAQNVPGLEKQPRVKEWLERITATGASVVRIPDDNSVLKAFWEGESIANASSGLREAYINLVMAVAHKIPHLRAGNNTGLEG